MQDLISRQEAIDALADMHCKSDEDGYVWIIRSDAWARIDALPSAQQEQRWIPCSERLPEEARHYLCSFNRPNRIDRIYVDLAYWTGGRWYGYAADAILAWMPLPEPWRGEE